MKNVFLFFFIFIPFASFSQLTGPISTTTAEGNFAQYLSKSQLKSTNEMADKSAAVFTFNKEENTKGTRFLFDDWVKGDSLVTKEGSKLNVGTYFFNFDKLNGDLLASENKKDVLAVSAKHIQSFELAANNKQYNFEHVNSIDSTKFFLALVKNSDKYCLYKQFILKYVPSNYRNDGLIETGTRDNEYKDESRYYVVMPDHSFRLVSMKTKALKDIFLNDRDKANQYFSKHRDDDMDEHFLTGLVEYVNQ